jgi:hypothetical protein
MQKPKTPAGRKAGARKKFGDAETAAFLRHAVAQYVARLKNLSFEQFEASQEPPHLNLAHGSAGVAYALLHASKQFNDPDLLPLARRWVDWSFAQSGKPDAFTAGVFVGEIVNAASLFYGMAGLHYVDALVAGAMHDNARVTNALDAWQALPAPPHSILHDVMSGGAGCLLGMGRLKIAFPNSSLDATGNHLYALLCDARPSELRRLGMAHGLGGYYFSLLEWATLSDCALPPWFWPDLDQLIRDGEWSGPTAKWPVERGAPAESHRYMHTWCNGAPGLALLWARAYESTAETRFLELACGCGRHVLAAVPYLSHLCCGKAGAAYALLALSRIEPDKPWKSPALKLAARAILHERLDSWNESLLKGRAGLLCLALDVLDTRPAYFPCVEVPVTERSPIRR